VPNEQSDQSCYSPAGVKFVLLWRHKISHTQITPQDHAFYCSSTCRLESLSPLTCKGGRNIQETLEIRRLLIFPIPKLGEHAFSPNSAADLLDIDYAQDDRLILLPRSIPLRPSV